MHVISRLGSVIIPLIASVSAAGFLGFVAWHLLPYEALERQTTAERFALWESLMWMIGLALAFFGLAAFFGSSDMYVRHSDPYLNRSAEHIRIQVQQGVRGRKLFSDLPSVPWLMMGTGTAVLLLAIATRSFVG